MTSPFTDRCMSVTSSGRSSTSTTIRWHSGLFVVMAFAMDCSTMVLPAFGGDTISARCPLPTGITRSMTRVVSMCGSVSRRSRSFGYSGVSLVNSGRSLGLVRVQAVDRVDAHQRVELLPLLLAVTRLAHDTGDGVTATQAVLADQRQRDVDVVRAGQVAGGAHERVVVQHVQDAADGQQDVVLADLGVRRPPPPSRPGLLSPLATAPTAPAVAEPAAATATALVVIVGWLLPRAGCPGGRSDGCVAAAAGRCGSLAGRTGRPGRSIAAVAAARARLRRGCRRLFATLPLGRAADGRPVPGRSPRWRHLLTAAVRWPRLRAAGGAGRAARRRLRDGRRPRRPCRRPCCCRPGLAAVVRLRSRAALAVRLRLAPRRRGGGSPSPSARELGLVAGRRARYGRWRGRGYPPCRSLMAAIRSPLRMPVVPLMPS